MELVGKRITHSTFGTGVIESVDSNKIIVKFDSQDETKKFIIPDCFEKFVIAEDSSFNEYMKNLLTEKKTVKTQNAETYRNVNPYRETGKTTAKQKSQRIIPDHRGNVLKGLREATKITINDDYCFERSVDVLNVCFGKKYSGWQRGVCYLDEAKTVLVWFPKMAVVENGILKSQSTTKEWINTLSDDGATIIMESHTEYSNSSRYEAHITFAKYPGEPYKYIGTFRRDKEASQPQKVVFRRIATEEDLTRWR